MNRPVSPAKSLLFSLFLLTGALSASAQNVPGVAILLSGPGELVLRLSSLQPDVTAGNGIDNVAQRWFFQEDSSHVPQLRGLVALPSGATSITLEKIGRSAETAALRVDRLTNVSALPESSILGINDYAGVRLVSVGLDPYVSDGSVLRVPRHVDIRLTWQESSEPGRRTTDRVRSLSRVEQELARDVPHFAEALAGRGRIDANRLLDRPSTRVASAPSGAWGIGEEVLILLVDEDGPYRLPASVFAANGGVEGVEFSRLRLSHRGAPYPFYFSDDNGDGRFEGDDYLAFRGWRNRSAEGFYYSEITDTNAYVLSWSGGEGDRPVAVETAEPSSAPTGTYRATLHIEKELKYFPGMTLPELLEGDETTVHVTERVQHERYYWGSVQDTRTEPFTFDCSPAYRPGSTTRVDVRLVSTQFPSFSSVDSQRVRIFLNDYLIGEVEHPDSADITYSFTIPGNVPVNGTNRLAFDYGEGVTTDFRNVLVDYIELTGEFNAIAENGVLRVPTDQLDVLLVDGLARESELPGEGRIDVVGEQTYTVVSAVEKGHLVRVTSRAGTALRTLPGFFLQVGEESFRSEGNNALGVSVAELAPGATGLRVVRYRHIRTTGEVTLLDQVADFIDAVPSGNIVVAGTAFGTSHGTTTPRFENAFRSLGSTVVGSESLFASSWVFAAIKGAPTSAVEEYGGGGDRGISRNLFIPDSQRGVSRRGIALSSETDGADLVLARPMLPDLRYHDTDRLLDRSNRADLIIVTHPLFRSEAERLAEHRRSHSGLEVAVVDLYRVYNEFNFGEKDPVAIRRFLQYADTNWGEGSRAPSYVILFGDASWDAEQRIPGSRMIDYLPSFGNPSTDQKFVVAFGDTTLTPQQFIGRLPAASVEDARTMVDKLIAYDLLLPAEWQKHFVFATGGTNVRERDNLRDAALSLASIITSDRFYGSAEVIARSGTTDGELKFPNTVDGPRVQAAMNRGGLWLDFNGHGATTTLDLNFGYPEDFDNGAKQFILATWSCQTGLFSNRDAQLRNELFLTHPGKGSIASIGGTSFSYTNMDDGTRRLIFSKIAYEPESRTIGSIFHLSKLELYAQFFYGSPFVSGGTRARNQTMMYTLLGDPSMRIAVSSRPELTVPVESVRLIGERGADPSLGDTTMQVRGALWNFGVPLSRQQRDSIGVPLRITLVDPTGAEISVLDTVYGLRRHDSLDLSLPVGEIPGEYVVIIDVDQDDLIAEEHEEDNRTVVQFLLRGSQPLTLEPLANGIVDDPDQVEIRILNPASGPGADFIIDTTASFSSPLARSSQDLGSVLEGELVTTWRLSIPQEMRRSEVLWWRATSTAGDPDLAARYPLVASFRIRSDEPASQPVAIGGEEQMSRTRLEELVNRPDGVGPGERLVPMEVTSIGQTFQGRDNSYPEINEPKLTVRVGSVNYRVNSVDGINVLVFRRNDVVPVIDTFFTFYSGTPLAHLEDLVANRIEPGERVVVASSGASFEIQESDAYPRLSALLDQLGSRVADTIGDWDWWGSYALIGGKGVADREVREAWIPGGVLFDQGELAPFPVTVRDTIIAFPRDGRWTSQVVGPALAWRSVSFDLVDAAAAPEAEVLGVRRDGRRDLLLSRDLEATRPSIDLSSIDPLAYPRLEFALRFAPDTTQRLRRVDVDFQPAPELAVVPSSVRIDHDSVLQGDPVHLTATVANLTSFAPATEVSTQIRELGETGGVVDTLVVPRIDPLDSATISLTVTTSRLRSGRSYLMEVNPLDRPSEPYSHNNRSRTLDVAISTDGVSPSLAIYADRNRLMNGDFVSPQPTFEVRLFDNSRLDLDEVRTITMVLDNEWITVESGATFEVPVAGDDDLRGAFRWMPPEPLSEGAHDLRVFARDASGNGDTTEILTFFVERELGVRALYTWPNPMQRETTFTFTVTGELAPESGEIAIFTPAGRKIRTIPLGPGDLSVGNNRIEWDGRDADGDRLANGVYFYRLRIRSGEERVEVLDKIAVLR